ncbi:MAG: SpoIIE family protein phosphatase [Gammaproteobacteria bacterium]|nr:SpoIIE family protein phosphatase [Gammaproteobacteria bacterium]
MTNRSLTILIAEDTLATQVLLTKTITRLGHQPLLAENGQQAVELYSQHHPDILLCDINMPIMNGLDAIREIRKQTCDYWVPILILSASDQDEDIIRGIEAGADDYLAKPFYLDILRAKINAMQRLVDLQYLNRQNTLKLKAANQELELEQTHAKDLADIMLNDGDLQHSTIEYWLLPNLHFSGDLITAKLVDKDKLFVMLADSTGHGLSAFLPTFIIAKVFHAMAKKRYSLSGIITEMNTSAKSLLPPDRFVAVNIFLINFSHRTIESWCGGLPDSLAVNAEGDIVKTFKSSNLAIGILAPEQFDSETELWQWQEPIELFAFTDGITEAANPNGELFGEQVLLDILKNTAPKQRFEQIKQSVLTHIQQDQGQDDISLLSIDCH